MDAVKNQGKIPKGLEKLIETCNTIYPNQPNPLQVRDGDEKLLFDSFLKQ